MVLVMMILSTSVFLWTLSQNTLYNQALKERNQMELDRLNEKVTAYNVNYTVSGDVVTVEVLLKNEGTISIRITTLWVLDTTIKKYGFNNTLDLNLKPGENISLVNDKAISVELGGANSDDIFNSWFITTRGNAVLLEREQGVIVAELSQGIGSLALKFYSFRYFEYEDSGDVLENYPNGTVSFNVPVNTEVAYGVALTNLDPRKETIVLDSHSLLWVIIPTSDVAHNRWWYIVNVASNGTISPTFSSISIAYGETKLLIFASENDLASADFARQSTPSSSCSVPVFLILHGTIGDSPYGQNLPFVSLFFYS